MIKLDSSKEYFYFCTSAGWSTVVQAKDENKAANAAVKEAIESLKDQAEVSPCIRVKKIKEKFGNKDFLIRMDKVFADIGMHKESRSLSEICKNLGS
tara:strand:+ start:124 stop:414 length:291 start_codon:yes stop_codon:yes gene_type:complete